MVVVNPRKARGSRKSNIPHDFILKWQSSGPKPLVRRPITACQACRIARVKCDNQPQCERCLSRNIVCRYTTLGALDTPLPSKPSSATDAAQPIAPLPTTRAEIPVDLGTTDATNLHSMGTTTYDEAFEAMADWSPDAGDQALDDLTWLPMDTNLNVQNRTTATPLFQPIFSSAITIGPTDGLSQPNQLFSLPECRCRESVLTLVPKVNTAMQEKQFGDVFKGMQRVVEGFQDMVQCIECNIGCVDLICIMAVFKQTGAGFEYIARADLCSAINMTFGGREVPIDDPKLRAMLITSLIYQANTVLDAISAKGQHMLRTLCTPSLIPKTNIDHLETVIEDFRNVLRRVAETADKAALTSKQASSTP